MHPVDGARYVRQQGQERLASLVAYHSGARFEAGQRVVLEERIAEILERYPPADPVHRAITRSHPMLREAVERTRARLAVAADQPM